MLENEARLYRDDDTIDIKDCIRYTNDLIKEFEEDL